MSLRDRIRQFFADRSEPGFGATAFGPVNVVDGDASTTYSESLVEWIRSDADLAPSKVYQLQAAMRICVNFLALNIAHLKLKSYRRVSDTERIELTPDEHPLPALLAAPNLRTTGFEMIRALVSDVGLYDAAYLLKGARQVPSDVSRKTLHRLPPSYVTVKGGDIIRGPESYEVRLANGQPPATFPPDQIIHFHGYNPEDTRIGLSLVRALHSLLNEESEASKHRRNYWRNAGRFDGIIQRPADGGPWTDDRRKRFREDWRSRYTGSENAGIPQILEDGMEWKSTAFSPKDSEFIPGREWALEVAATAYQIPLAMLSRSKTATYASMKEFHKVLYVDVLGPWNAFIESVFGLQLIPEFKEDDIYVEFNIEEKLQGDFEEQAAAARSAVQVPFMSVDDMRAKRGLPALGGEFSKPAKPANYVFEGEEVPENENDQEEPVRRLELLEER